MEILNTLRSQIEQGDIPEYEHLEKLRALREEIEDIEDILQGNPNPSLRVVRQKSKGSGFAVVVGHTNEQQGAQSVSPINSSEYRWNTNLAQMIKSECDKLGIECKIFFRDGIGISGAYKRVGQWGAKCVVELHFNASNGKALGSETLYDAGKNAHSKGWAETLQREIVAVFDRSGKADRGLREVNPGDRGYASCSALNIPSALVEPFFGDNKFDALLAHQHKDDLASAIAEAAKKFVSIS
jgi:N-acetylmuramoyl-L-alanine amidase